MPNLKRVQAELAKWKRALGALKGGDPIEVDDVLMLPSMGDGDSESDLTTCERMIERLTARAKSARDQGLRKGLTVEGDGGVKHIRLANGAPALVAALSLTQEDVDRIVPTGSNSCVSKRDVRSYAKAKESDSLKAYFVSALARKDGKAPSEEEVEAAMKFTAVEPDYSEPEGPKALKDLGKPELVKECENRGLKTTGTKKALLKLIKAYDKEAEAQAEADEEEAPEDVDDSADEEPQDVNPLA